MSATREWSPTTEARVHGFCTALLLGFMALAAWAVLMATEVVPAMPWSPLGQQQEGVTQERGPVEGDPLDRLEEYMRKHHLKPAVPSQPSRPTPPETTDQAPLNA